MIRTALLLLVCFIFAQADKQVMGLLAVPIQRSFGLSDTQLGLLQGGAFAIAFAIGGLPIARLLDGGNRVRIAAACVAAWSAATMACGVAGSFAVLALGRAATAFAEAGLPPAAFSIFSETNDKRLATRMTGVFMLAPFIGGGLILVLGGMLLRALDNGALVLPGESWRWVFIAIALPGFILAPMLAILGREPRTMRRDPVAASKISYRQVLAHIFVECPFLRYYYCGLTAFYMVVAAFAGWYPAHLERELGLSTSTAGAYAGLTFLIAGVAGTVTITALLSSRQDISSRRIVRDFVVLAAAAIPVALALSLVQSVAVSVTLYGVFAFLSAGILAALPIPMQLSLADSIKARGIAVGSLMMSAVAGTAGPLIVGLLSDGLQAGLGVALAVVAIFGTLTATLLLFLAWRAAASDTA